MAKPRLPWSPVRDIMKSAGAQMVSRQAVDLVITVIEDKVRELTTAALKLTRHGKRTKVSRDDIDMVLKMR